MGKLERLLKQTKINESDSGQITIPKTHISNAKDPDAVRLEISKHYEKMVLDYPEYDLGILVDRDSDAILITWRKR